MGRYSYFEAGKRVFVLQQKDKTTNQNIDYFADLLEDSTIRDSTSFLEYRSLSTWALEKLRIRNPRRKSVNAWEPHSLTLQRQTLTSQTNLDCTVQMCAVIADDDTW